MAASGLWSRLDRDGSGVGMDLRDVIAAGVGKSQTATGMASDG
jgi:hypothetical protein